MANRYIFDKRDIKKGLIKYAIIFVIALAVLLPLNIFVFSKYLDRGMSIFLCVIIGLAIILLSDLVIYKIKEHRENKFNNKK